MNTKFKVLVADDSVEDQQITQFVLKNDPNFQINTCVSNGDQVIAYFNGWHAFADRTIYPLPDILLLDLDMPYRDGFEVLRWLKSHPQADLIIVMFTSSDLEEHVNKASALGANGYIVKPSTVRELQSVPGRLLAIVNGVRYHEEGVSPLFRYESLGPTDTGLGSFL
jgi:CheY-like chemotaxis protein